jgi:hypothetical protein
VRERPGLEHRLRRTVRRLRLLGGAAVVAAVLAVVPLVMLAAWLVGERWGIRGAGPLSLLTAGTAVAAAAATVLTRRWISRVNQDVVAAAAERARGMPEGSLRGVLELGRSFPPGVSFALFRRSVSEVEGWLSAATPRQLAGDLGPEARRRSGVMLVGAVGLGLLAAASGFVSPDRARAGWAPLLRPVAHLEGPVLPPLGVSPGDARVDRGAGLDVVVEARLRREVSLHWRAVGDVPRSRLLPVEEGRASGSLGPVDAPLDYWVSAPDGSVTDTFRVVPVDPLLVTALTVEVDYPAHLGKGPDRFEGSLPPLVVPEGTVLRVSGRATRPLTAATLRREDGAARALAVDEESFRLDWRLDRGATGWWVWELSDSSGGSPGTPEPLELDVVADAPPEVRITVPGADTLMPASRQQPVVADAADDHGIASAALVFRTVSGAGDRSAQRAVPLPVDAVEGRVLLQGVLDATSLTLVAGDAVEYHVVVMDNSPGKQAGRSATYVLRLPGMAELRDRARETASEALAETERLTENARELAASTRDLSRKAAGGRSGPPGGSGGEMRREQLGFEAAAEAHEVASRNEDALARIEELRGRIDELERTIEEAGLRDPEIERRLNELRDLYSEAATPELQEDIQRLGDAVESLDPEAVNQALEALAERQDELREQLERSLELMRRVAAEQELATLAREAEEIAGQQEALARAMEEESRAAPMEDPTGSIEETSGGGRRDSTAASEGPSRGGEEPRPDPAAGDSTGTGMSPPGLPSPPNPPNPLDRVKQQEELEDRAGKLGQSLRALQPRLLQIGEGESATQAGSAQQKGESARQSMQEAADQARQEQGGDASRSGRRAASQMADAASTLDAARRQMGNAQRGQAEQAVQQATQEALALAQRQEALRQQMERVQQGDGDGEGPGEVRSEQAALQEGLEQLGRNLTEAGQRSGLVDREVRQALERARLNMQSTLDGMADAPRRMPVEQAERSVESLNQLAMSLLQNGSRISESSASSLQRALQHLAELAREQGSLNGETAAVTPLDLGERALQQQLQQMAQRQRGIGRRVGEASEMMGGRDDVLGQVDQLSVEAEQIARALEGGRLDAEVRARQERLFNRLLDAGRSLEREEYSSERASRSAAPVESTSPDALAPELLDPWIRYPVPSAEELRLLTPAYRRLILEYFDRLNRSAAEAPEGRNRGGDG